MDLEAFRSSLSEDAPPAELGPALQALWWDAAGNWDKAHECAQAKDDEPGMRVHAYLHRKEGDLDNARYWYRRVAWPEAKTSLDEEWTALARDLLSRS